MREWLRRLKALHSRAQGYAQGVETQLTIAFDTIFPRQWLAHALASGQNAFPTVVVRLVTMAPADPVQLVAGKRADIGIGLSHEALQHPVKVERICVLNLISVASATHPLALLSPGFDDSQVREHTEIRVLDATRILGDSKRPNDRENAWVVVDLESIRELVIAGLGWGLLPEHASMSDLACGNLVALRPTSRLPDGKTPAGIHMVTHADKPVGPALGVFMERLGIVAR